MVPIVFSMLDTNLKIELSHLLWFLRNSEPKIENRRFSGYFELYISYDLKFHVSFILRRGDSNRSFNAKHETESKFHALYKV